jgi:hypothetical protein
MEVLDSTFPATESTTLFSSVAVESSVADPKLFTIDPVLVL